MSDFTSRLTQVNNDNLDEDLMPVDAPLPPHLASATDVNEQQVQEIDNNEEVGQVLRDDALFLKGVDNLSTREIKLYLDSLLRPNISLEELDKNKFKFRLEWINDSSINVAFEYLVKNKSDDELLIDTSNLLNEALRLISLNSEDCDTKPNDELRMAHPYNKNALAGLTISADSNEFEEQPLEVRQSFNTDVKVKAAGKYSRYYLIHGEPTRFDRERSQRQKYRQRDTPSESKSNSRSYYEEYLNQKRQSTRSDAPDLFTGEEGNNEGGLLNYETEDLNGDDRFRDLKFRSQQGDDEENTRKWSNDRYGSQDLRDRIGRHPRGPGGGQSRRFPQGPRGRGGPVAYFRRDEDGGRRDNRPQGRERRLNNRYEDEEDLLPNFKSKNQDVDMEYERERQRDRSPDRM